MLLVIATKCCDKLNDYLKKLRSRAFLNGILAFWDGIYLTLAISSALNIKQYMDGNVELDSSMYASCVWAILVVLVHPLVLLLICCKFKTLSNESVQSWFGIFYTDLNTKSRAIVLYPLFYHIRMLTLAMVAVFWNSYPVQQLTVMMALDIIIIAVIGLSRAFKIRRVRKYELCGEALNLFYADIFLCLLNEGIPEETRNVLGWTLVVSIGLTILTGASRLLVQAFRRTCRRCRLRKARKNAQKKAQ